MNLKVLTLTLSLSSMVLLAVDANASRLVTLYLDGAMVEQRENAKKGYLEIYLPPDALKDSLRIAPANGAEIQRVDTAILKPAKSIEKELAQLSEREGILNDRLKALSVREEIFKSAAKSQSAKAPRRTKTNPEPLSTIKQGTDYAITQLESVYYAKRKTEKELASIAERRLSVGKADQSGGTVARIWVTPAGGSVTATWLQTDRRWVPQYQIRVDEKERAVLTLMAPGVILSKGESTELALAPLQTGGKVAKFKYDSDLSAIKKELFKVNGLSNINLSPQSVTFTNSSIENLPPGEISCFKSGVYVGKGLFQGAEPGKTTEIVCHGR